MKVGQDTVDEVQGELLRTSVDASVCVCVGCVRVYSRVCTCKHVCAYGICVCGACVMYFVDNLGHASLVLVLVPVLALVLVLARGLVLVRLRVRARVRTQLHMLVLVLVL